MDLLINEAINLSSWAPARYAACVPVYPLLHARSQMQVNGKVCRSLVLTICCPGEIPDDPGVDGAKQTSSIIHCSLYTRGILQQPSKLIGTKVSADGKACQVPEIVLQIAS